MSSVRHYDIEIRPARSEDATGVTAIYARRSAFGDTLQLPFPSESWWRERLTAPPEGVHDLVALVDGNVVGMVSLHTYPNRPRRRHAATLGIGVHDDWQGRGVGGALMAAIIDLADNWLNIVRLELEVFADNAAGIRLYERHGFSVEGHLKKFGFRDGRYVDAIAMGRIRPERSA